MPTADATLLPPALSSFDRDDDGPRSVRSLESVGVETVLGAMIEQRRASRPSFASVILPSDADGLLELSADDLDEDRGAARAPTTSEVFLKAR